MRLQAKSGERYLSMPRLARRGAVRDRLRKEIVRVEGADDVLIIQGERL